MAEFSLKDDPDSKTPSGKTPMDFDVLKGINHISELQLETELLEVYRRAKRLLASVETDMAIAPNHKVQAANSVNTILQDIVKTQERFYNVETLKAMEICLIETLKAFPDLKDDFMARYSEALKGVR